MNPVGNLTCKDKQALMSYLGIVLLCAGFFAAGIFVGGPRWQSYGAVEAKPPASGFTVRVFDLSSAAEAQELSARLRAQGHADVTVEPPSEDQGYAVKIGPLEARAAADELTLELRNAGYSTVKVSAGTQGR
jgi:cell division septation protein DedD